MGQILYNYFSYFSKVDLTPTFPFNFMNDQETQYLNNLLEQIRNK